METISYPNLFFTFQFSFMWVGEKRKNNRILPIEERKRSHTQNLEDSLNHHIPIKVIEREKVNHKSSPQNKSSLCDYNIFQENHHWSARACHPEYVDFTRTTSFDVDDVERKDTVTFFEYLTQFNSYITPSHTITITECTSSNTQAWTSAYCAQKS